MKQMLKWCINVITPFLVKYSRRTGALSSKIPQAKDNTELYVTYIYKTVKVRTFIKICFMVSLLLAGTE